MTLDGGGYQVVATDEVRADGGVGAEAGVIRAGLVHRADHVIHVAAVPVEVAADAGVAVDVYDQVLQRLAMDGAFGEGVVLVGVAGVGGDDGGA